MKKLIVAAAVALAFSAHAQIDPQKDPRVAIEAGL